MWTANIMGIFVAQIFLLFLLPLPSKASIATSQFTSYKIKSFEDDQSHKTSKKESIVKCKASCIFATCNVFLYDKKKLLCTTKNHDRVKLQKVQHTPPPPTPKKEGLGIVPKTDIWNGIT